MASLRCPGCGAKNQGEPVKCRICGYDLRGHAEQPLTQPKPGTATMKKTRLSPLFALAAVGVVLMVLAGVLLGLLPGGDVISDIRNKVPFLAAQADDGWEQFTEASASFRATMPVDRVQKQAPFQWSTTGTIDQWVSTLGPDGAPDTTLGVQWATMPAVPGQDVKAELTSLAIGWADSMGGKVAKSQDTSFQGYPALVVKIDGLQNAQKESVTVRALLVRQRDELFVLSSTSIYPDHPQFDRLVNGFALL